MSLPICSRVMEEDFQQIINSKFDDLIEYIDPCISFWALLRKKGVTTPAKEEEIKVGCDLRLSSYLECSSILYILRIKLLQLFSSAHEL